MKKLILSICFLFLIVPFAHASWTVAVSLDRSFDYDDGSRMYVFKFDCASDASSSGDLALTTLLKTNTAYGATAGERELKVNEMMKQISGGVLYYIKYQPDTVAVPSTQSTITIDDETTALVFSEQVTTAATAQGWEGCKDTADTFPPITDLTVAATTLGNEDEAVIWVWIKR